MDTNQTNLTFKFLDSAVGSGKTTAIIELINKHKNSIDSTFNNERFLVVVMYKTEIERLVGAIGAKQPLSIHGGTKRNNIVTLIENGENIVCSQALYHMLPLSTLKLFEQRQYNCIFDEAPTSMIGDYNDTEETEDNPNCGEPIYPCDVDILLSAKLIKKDNTNKLTWEDNNPITKTLQGKLLSLKRAFDKFDLYQQGDTIIYCLNPHIFQVFKSVMVCGYQMQHSLLKAYCDLYNIKIEWLHIEDNNIVNGYRNTKPTGLERIIPYTPKTRTFSNGTGKDINTDTLTYSQNCWKKISKSKEIIKWIFNAIRTWISQIPVETYRSTTQMIWTVFKTYKPILTVGTHHLCEVSKGKTLFLPCSTKATNDYKDRHIVVYLIDRFLSPNIKDFLWSHNVKINEKQWALSEFIQFVWRSNIRDKNSNDNVYVFSLSHRLYDSFNKWIKE